ncbi:MAG: hypothetical protein NC834_02590 [Candidatus Omnitrophica bacterium]|nr:hypothetical protein [Candidatus Omnitrophota bacterium]
MKKKKAPEKFYPLSAEIIRKAIERIESEAESERFIKKLFEKHITEVLDIDYFDKKQILISLLNKSAKNYFYTAMNLCIDLRRELIAEKSPIKKISKILLYPYRLCPILKAGALEDGWVQKGIKLIRLVVIDKSIPIKIRKGLKNILERIFASMIPSLKGQKDRPDGDIILSEYEMN